MNDGRNGRRRRLRNRRIGCPFQGIVVVVVDVRLGCGQSVFSSACLIDDQVDVVDWQNSFFFLQSVSFFFFFARVVVVGQLETRPLTLTQFVG